MIPSILWGVAEIWRQYLVSKEAGYPSSFFVAVCLTLVVKIVVAVLLWLKAGSFGQWLDKTAPPASPPIEMNASAVASALILGAAGYWFMVSLTDALFIYSDARRQASETFQPITDQIWVEVALLIIAVVAALASRPLAGFLCKR